MAGVEGPIFGEHDRLASLVGFSRSATAARTGRRLAEHTAAALDELGYPAERIDALQKAGVVLADG